MLKYTLSKPRTLSCQFTLHLWVVQRSKIRPKFEETLKLIHSSEKLRRNKGSVKSQTEVRVWTPDYVRPGKASQLRYKQRGCSTRPDSTRFQPWLPFPPGWPAEASALEWLRGTEQFPKKISFYYPWKNQH